MKTFQYSDLYHLPAGKTHTETRKAVIVAGTYNIECCPFLEVDGELEYIFKMVKVRPSLYLCLYLGSPPGFLFL